MFYKTNSQQFSIYGLVSNATSQYPVFDYVLKEKRADYFYRFSVPMSYESVDGIAGIAILEDDGRIQYFIMQNHIIINSNTPFTLFSITDSAHILESPQTSNPHYTTVIPINRPVEYKAIEPTLKVNEIYNYNYSVSNQEHVRDNTSHNYWELIFVDETPLYIETESICFMLEPLSIVLYAPNQYQSRTIINKDAGSYLSVVFDMNGPSQDLNFFKDRIFHCSQRMRYIIAEFIQSIHALEMRDLPFSRDLMISYLQELIIFLRQYDTVIPSPSTVQAINSQAFLNDIFPGIVGYIHKNINKNITVNEICKAFSVSRSMLYLIFKDKVGVGPKKYINDTKMKFAKQYLREQHSITEVASMLGYSSIHYFSRKFKADFSISPSEYIAASRFY